jgi:quercetin dioxygenase-like cupin family protein
MISVVRFEPGARGTLHHHPEEQWGYCVSGSGLRFQAEEAIEVSPGDFWRTPGNVPHTMQAGSEGLVVIDVFAPPREEYKKPGSGFGTAAG